MKIFGHLDLCSPTLIEGWLYSDGWQGEPILLQVYVGTRLLGEVVANRFRSDLQDAGYGDGHCGFSFPIPDDVELTGLAETRLRLVNTPVYLLPTETTSFVSAIAADDSRPAGPPTATAEAASFSAGSTHDMGSSYGDPRVQRPVRKGYSVR